MEKHLDWIELYNEEMKYEDPYTRDEEICDYFGLL